MKNKNGLEDYLAGEETTVVLNSEAEYVGVTEDAADVCGYETKNLLGRKIDDVLKNPSCEHGRRFQKKLDGEITEDQTKIIGDDGQVIKISAEYEPITVDGEPHLRAHIEAEGVERPSEPQVPEFASIEDIDDVKLAEIVQNVRVESPKGEMTLNTIMLDLAVGHNELEQYKKGALSMYQALDERLQEEERRNPDSPEVEVIREVKRSAFGLYLRLQRGDEELHGNREGKYSGYFN